MESVGIKDNSDNESDRHPWMGYCKVALVITGFVINLRVVWFVSKLPRLIWQSRATQLVLVVHLAVVTMALGVTCFWGTMEDFLGDISFISKQLNWPGRAIYSCRIWKYLETTLFSVFPLNVVGIIRERIKHSDAAIVTIIKIPKLVRLPLLFWAISLVISIPTGFMYETNSISGKCQPIQLYGSVWITLFYELIRFQIFHVTTVAYVIHALIKVCFTEETNHHKSDNPNHENSLSSSSSVSSTSILCYGVRSVYIYFLSFIIIWFFAGLLFLLEIIFLYSSPFSSSSFNQKFGIYTLIIYTYMFLTPHLNLRLIDGVESECTCGFMDVTVFEDGEDEDGYENEDEPSAVLPEENVEQQEESSSEEEWNRNPKKAQISIADTVTSFSVCNVEVHPIPGNDDSNDINDFTTSDSPKKDANVKVDLNMHDETKEKAETETSFSIYNVGDEGIYSGGGLMETITRI